ncbi:TPA: hypothetical protein H1005_02550 [archaeon]|nr:hypothetical protein [Candidatus Naiadarchaeales archaeon SRR2090153.bin1042]
MPSEDTPRFFQGPIKIGIDVSGRAFSSVHIGLSSMSTSHENVILKEFEKAFPHYSKDKRKASNLDQDELIKIIKFLDEKKVHMGSINISQKRWEELKRTYNNKQWFEEKTFGVYYSHLLKQITAPRKFYKHRYDVVCCQESFMNINKVLDICKRI